MGVSQNNTVHELTINPFDSPDDATTFPNGRADSVSLDGMTMTQATMEPGGDSRKMRRH